MDKPSLETRLKETQKALQESETRYHRLMEQAPDGILITDQKGNCVEVNSRACEMLGYTPEELRALNVRDLLPPENPARASFCLDEMRQGGTVVQEGLARRKDGTVLAVATSACLREDGKFQAMIRDITEQKRTERFLRDWAERYQLLFENNPFPMWVVDLETLAFLTVNEAAIRHYGYSKEEFLSMTIKDIRPPEDIPKALESLARNAPGLTVIAQRRHRKKDGTLITVETTRHTLTFVGRRAALVMANDITERRSLEEQLRQAQKMEAVGRLAGGIAHDFNNLLTVILGYSDLLLRQLAPDQPMRNDVQEIRKAGATAESLTRQLLAFSRRQVLQSEVLDLNSVVADMGTMLERLIGKNIQLEMALQQELDQVTADRGQIEQVIMNLVVNANDAMPNGGRLTIETRNAMLDAAYARDHTSVAPGRYAMLAVSDTGVGMDRQTLARIFEPFFTTKAAGKGTGLGLSTVYGIVKQSGGNVWVYSEPNQGTVFKIYLPAAAVTLDERSGSAAEETHPGRATETILLLEDDDAVRTLTRDLLARIGYTVLEARNGEEALRIGQHHRGPISLMLADIGMEGIDGREVARRLSPLRPEMRILFMSGYSDIAVFRQGLLDPGAAFFGKPFTADSLLHKVREVLKAPVK